MPEQPNRVAKPLRLQTSIHWPIVRGHAAAKEMGASVIVGWPIGSGPTEAGVKQFNKRVKGTDQFWTRQGVEPIFALRELWMDQDGRWERYWATRSAYGFAQAA